MTVVGTIDLPYSYSYLSAECDFNARTKDPGTDDDLLQHPGRCPSTNYQHKATKSSSRMCSAKLDMASPTSYNDEWRWLSHGEDDCRSNKDAGISKEY